MAYLPKDYSQHENKIFLGLSLKKIFILLFFIALSVVIVKISFLSWVTRIILLIPVFMLAPVFIFYKTVDGDDILTYLFKLIVYYSSPKYLVYRKINKNIKPNETREERK